MSVQWNIRRHIQTRSNLIFQNISDVFLKFTGSDVPARMFGQGWDTDTYACVRQKPSTIYRFWKVWIMHGAFTMIRYFCKIHVLKYHSLVWFYPQRETHALSLLKITRLCQSSYTWTKPWSYIRVFYRGPLMDDLGEENGCILLAWREKFWGIIWKKSILNVYISHCCRWNVWNVAKPSWARPCAYLARTIFAYNLPFMSKLIGNSSKFLVSFK